MSTAPSPRTTIKRKSQRAHYDQASLHAVLDAAFVCHVAFRAGDSIHTIPTACWRQGEHLYVHGAHRGRMMEALLAGESCVSITHLDGLVLARSAFHHSMNYRSAVLYGRFEPVDDPAAKAASLAAFVDHVSPGRSAQVRAPTPAELAGTVVLRMGLEEAAVKIRNWGVEDDAADMGQPVWAGVIPLALGAGSPEPDTLCGAHPHPALPACLTPGA
jgi:nitroimidazol reductase NimA-like FMN-containing flavoprotein (pyridoxamine 5'-phosphate oxidase superfamily)